MLCCKHQFLSLTVQESIVTSYHMFCHFIFPSQHYTHVSQVYLAKHVLKPAHELSSEGPDKISYPFNAIWIDLSIAFFFHLLFHLPILNWGFFFHITFHWVVDFSLAFSICIVLFLQASSVEMVLTSNVKNIHSFP